MRFNIEQYTGEPSRKTARYPFASMRPGDTVFLRCADNRSAKKKIGQAAYAAQRRGGFRFIVQWELEGVRVWCA